MSTNFLLTSYNLNTPELYLTNINDGTQTTHNIPNFNFGYSCQIAIVPEWNGLLVTGGDNKTDVSQIDLASLTASPKPPMINPRYGHGSLYYDGFVYCFGGMGTPANETSEKYDVNQDAWVALPNMPIGVGLTNPIVVVPSKSVYICGGHRDNAEHTHIQVFNLETLAWRHLDVQLPLKGLALTVFKVGETSSRIWIVIPDKYPVSKLFSLETRSNEITEQKIIEDECGTTGGHSKFYKGNLYTSFTQGPPHKYTLGALRWEEIKGVLWALKCKSVLKREVVNWLGY